MKFQPKTENEVLSEGLLERGEYDYEIADATEKTSQAGNEMIELKVRVFDAEGNARVIFDYLLEAMAYKLRHAAYAVGLGDSYETGALEAQHFIGRTGRCKVGVQKDKTGAYPDKNIIQDYMVDPIFKGVAAANVAAGSTPAATLNDEIPF